MKKAMLLVVAMCVGMVSLSASAADTEAVLKDLAAKTKDSLVIVEFKVKRETGSAPVAGQAICIDASGIFVTTALNPAIKKELITDMRLILPGPEGKTVKASFMGVDPGTQLGFVKAEEKADWKAIQFVEAKLAAGQMVASVGVMGGDGNRTTYLGVGYVSAVLRVPGEMVYVTGGKLSNVGSPVFSADGKAIGLVGRQLPLRFTTESERGPLNLPLRGEEETSFFTPTAEFAQAIAADNIPKDGEPRRLPWVGIGVDSLSDENIKDNKIATPAVMVSQVIKGQPGDDAKMEKGDIITHIDGKPLEKLANPAYTVASFERALLRLRVGQKVKFTVLPAAQAAGSKKAQDVTLDVKAMPIMPNEAPRLFDQYLGMIMREKVSLDRFIGDASTAGIDGLIVEDLDPKGSAGATGVGRGDLITKINDKPVKTVVEYKDIEEEAVKAQAQSIKLTVHRGGQPVSLVVPVRKPAPAAP